MAKRFNIWVSAERRTLGGMASRKRGPHVVVVVINAGPYIQTVLQKRTLRTYNVGD